MGKSFGKLGILGDQIGVKQVTCINRKNVYIRLLRNIDEKEPGMCGLQRHVVYPKYKEQQ